jgi:phage FluMu protein Com
MAPKHHPTPLSGGDRKALTKELGKARAMTRILAAQSAEMRAKGKALIQQADKLLCESWNERMWSDGEPIDPSPTIDQAINGGFPWLEIQCARCKTPSDVDLAVLRHPPTTFVHDLANRLRCRKCAKTGRRPSATLLQLGWQPRHARGNA